MSTKLLENLKKDRTDQSLKNNKTKRYVMGKEGRYLFRILPNKDDADGLPYERVFLHFGFTHPNYNNPGTFRCLGRECPLCREAKKKAEDGHKEAWRFKSTPVYLYYIYDEAGVFQYLRLSQVAHNSLIDEITAMMGGKVNPLDLDKGRFVEVKLSKEEDKNVYKWTFLNELSVVPKNIRSELTSSPVLDDLCRKSSKEDLEKIVKGEKLTFGNSNGTSRNGTQTISRKDDGSAPKKVSHTSVDEDRSASSQEEVDELKARIRKQIGDG